IGRMQDSSLIATKVGDARFMTCASPGYLERKGRPACPEDLPEHHAINFTQINELPWRYSRGGERFRGLPSMRVRVNSPGSAVEGAVQGLGLIRILNFMVDEELRAGRLVPLFENYDMGSFPVYLVYQRQGLVPAKVRAFIDWMAPRL